MLTDETRNFITVRALAIKESLDQAMDAAHGVPFTVDELTRMSAVELLSLLAPNDVRFIYVGPTKEKKRG